MPGGTHLTRVHVTRSDFSILASYIRVREQVGSATNRGHLAKAGALRDDGANTVFVAFHLQPHKVLCVRLAVEMGLFDSLPPSAPFTLQDLIEYAGADPEFTGRVVRALGALNIFDEVEHETSGRSHYPANGAIIPCNHTLDIRRTVSLELCPYTLLSSTLLVS